MKIVELINNIQIPITNEQADILGRFDIEAEIKKSQLDEHEQLIMNQLVVQDIVHRANNNGQITYKKKIR
jgi:uncharacterized FlgJ-related protein